MLQDFYNKLVALQEFDIVSETTDIINKNRDTIVTLLQTQLQKGEDSEGNPVTIFGKPFYSNLTVFLKKSLPDVPALGRETEVITNYMYGNFYQFMRVRTFGEEFEITSDVPYFGDILARSGEVIMKLNEENLKIFAEEILFPEIQRRFTERFNAK